MNKRILPLDGLRTISVLGVLWVHLWSMYGNLPLMVGPVDVNKAMTILGNGVDLFFVISGFCMYLMYASKAIHFTLQGYGDFLAKRFKRIAPAYYVLIIIELASYFIQHYEFPYKTFFAHIFFANIFLSNNPFAPHYWSLATEWHFYLLLPFLFTGSGARKPLIARILVMIALCIFFRIVLFHGHSIDLANRITVNSDAIWYRFAEFGVGIIAAKCYIDGLQLPAFLSGAAGFLTGFIVAYTGRICMLTEFINLFGRQAFIIRSFGEPLMTAGFALIIYNVITTESIFSKLLSRRWMIFIGKISYSMYLWHWLVFSFVGSWVMGFTGRTNSGFYLSFMLSALAAIPVSWVSYRLLEMPYFKKDKSPQKLSAPSVAESI